MPQRKPAKAPPITAHPLFPAVVALWFAALFGLGSLAVRVGLLERLVVKSGIDLVIPAAAPPLGVTARILLSLCLGAAGAVVGLMIARRLGRRPAPARERKRAAGTVVKAELNKTGLKPRARDAHPDAPARRPLQAHEELGSDTLEPVAGPASGNALRRRALAGESESGFMAHVPEFAPLPGYQPIPLDLASFAEPLDAPTPAAAAFEPVFADPTPLAPAASPAPFEPLAIEPAHAELPPAPRQVFGEPGTVSTQSFTEVPAASHPEFAASAPDMVEPIPAAAPALSGHSEPLSEIAALGDRLALAMRRRREARAAGQAKIDAPIATPPEASPAPEPAVPENSPVLELPRLGAAPALTPDAAIAPATTPFTQPAGAPVAAPLPSLPASAELFEKRMLPAALRPLSFDAHDDDEADELHSLVPLRRIAMPPQAPATGEVAAAPIAAADETPVPGDDRYGSLLGLGAAAPRAEAVRISEPAPDSIEPVVIFPGQAARFSAPTPLAPATEPVAPLPPGAEMLEPASSGPFRRFDAPSNAGQGNAVDAAQMAPTVAPDEAERALRAALASLQRMSGAA